MTVDVKRRGTLGRGIKEGKKKEKKELWKIEAIFAFVPDETQRREAEIHSIRCTFVRYLDLNQ